MIRRRPLTVGSLPRLSSLSAMWRIAGEVIYDVTFSFGKSLAVEYTGHGIAVERSR